MSLLPKLRQRVVQNPVTGVVVLRPLVAAGYASFLLTRRTPWLAYRAMRDLYFASEGRFQERATRLIARFTPQQQFAIDEGLCAGADAQARALAGLREHGFYVFPQRLPQARIEPLVEYATRATATLVPAPKGGPAQAVFDRARPLAPRYQFSERDLLASAAVQRMVADSSLMALAQAYMGAPPINDLVTMWWSSRSGSVPSSSAAQLYHFDLDRFSFLKFFVYLTDVTPSSGPHVYVSGSHRERPQRFYREGRFSDDEVHAQFGSRVTEICGPAGTIFAADTKGLHKGKLVERGERLVFQLEFANSLFGQHYECVPLTAEQSPEFARELQRHPSVFTRFVS